MKKIILASSSPRRIEMMKKYGYTPSINPAAVDESLPFAMSPEAAVMYLSLKKASYIADKQKNSAERTAQEASVIVAADTVVVLENRIIGKPADSREAFETLSAMRGRSHHVITGVCIMETAADGSLVFQTCFYEDTTVFFKDYSDEELTAYVNTPEPYDKAGGYAIQETFKKYIDHIDGDFDNVVGFPWYRVKPFLQ